MPAPTPLLTRLVSLLKAEPIRHPQLRPVVLAQWLLESARATSALATTHYNFGGLKWRPEMRPWATRVAYQAHDGLDYYCHFATLESYIRGYWAFLMRAPYTGWEEHVDSGEDFIGFIGPTYSPSPGYVNRVLQLLPEATALLAASEPLVLPDVATVPGASLGTIIIDPGHGGEQNLPGSSANNAISASGVKEKKLTLEFALLLEERLKAHAGGQLTTVLTRRSDVNVPGAARAALAGQHGAQLLLSIHFNGSSTGLRGTETFYAAPENGNQNPTQDRAFATAVQKAVFDALKQLDAGARDRGVKPDTQTAVRRLAVLNDGNLGNTPRTRKCHAALLEVEFIDRPAVDRLLVSGPDAIANRRHVLDNLAKAIIDYLGTI